MTRPGFRRISVSTIHARFFRQDPTSSFPVKGDSYSLKLPEDLAPGDYLIRHEIIALHLAVSKGGAEFYPSCTQVRVSGDGSGKPQDTVTFPGAYSDSDPGIFDPEVGIMLWLSRSISPAHSGLTGL